MIFVTVGTHEQQFDRLVKEVDRLKKDNVIEDNVVIQTGFSTYEPRYCEWRRLYSYQQMVRFVEEARIVVTHGGPSSFILPLQMGKVPLVVPRQKQFGEHVNDHQIEFCRAIAQRQQNIFVVEEIQQLETSIKGFEKIAAELNGEQCNNNRQFMAAFGMVVEELMRSRKRK